MQVKNRGTGFQIVLWALALFALVALTVTGCGSKDTDKNGGTPGTASNGEKQPGQSGNNGQNPDISAKPAETTHQAMLYFGDGQAMYLIPEQREVVKQGDETLEAAIVRELIKGPENKDLTPVMPPETKLLSVSVVDGVAFVNFSKEFRTKHWGGSAGETMTLYGVTNTLGKLPGIEKVQFLLEGDRQESILNGNMDTSIPLEPDYSLVQE